MPLFGILGAALGAAAGPIGLATAGAAAAKALTDKEDTSGESVQKALKQHDTADSKARNEAADKLIDQAQNRIEGMKKLATKLIKQHRLQRTKILSGNINHYIENFALLKHEKLKAVAGMEGFEAFPPYVAVFQNLEIIGQQDLKAIEHAALVATKFNKELDKAKGRYNKAKAFEEQSRGFAQTVELSLKRLGQLELLLAKLDSYLGRSDIRLQQLFAEAGKDWNNYNPEQQKLVANGVRLAETVRLILEAPIFDKTGSFSRAAKNALLVGETILYELE